MKFGEYCGLGGGIFVGGVMGYFLTRVLELNMGISESGVVFLLMFLTGFLGKKIGYLVTDKKRKVEH